MLAMLRFSVIAESLRWRERNRCREATATLVHLLAGGLVHAGQRVLDRSTNVASRRALVTTAAAREACERQSLRSEDLSQAPFLVE